MPSLVAVYSRVSTTDQNPEMQIGELRAYCKARGWENVREYTDAGVSGIKVSRPALDQMLSHVRIGKVDCVLVWRYDRMSRSLVHLIETIDMLASFSCNFVSIKESFDTTTPVGRCMLQMVGAFAEFERSTLRSRVKAGIERAQKHGTKTGNPIGRPKVFFDRKVAEEMKAAGVSTHGIAKSLGVSQSSIYKELVLRK